MYFYKSVNFKERNFREKKPVDQFIKSLDLNRGISLLRRKGSGIIDERKVWNCKSEQLGGGIQMRDFFEDLGKRLGETAESLTNRASEVVEVQRIRGQIRALDRNNERDYRDIGRMIYEKYKNGEVIDTEMVCICEEIEKREATAEEMEQMIADSKGTTVCPNCHANLTPDMAYCPQCGEKVPEEEEEPEEEAADSEEAEVAEETAEEAETAAAPESEEA